jgi:tRNA(Ile2) C34 agmatinyltransferase TiaS
MAKAKIKKFNDYGFEADVTRAKIVMADSAYCENCGHRQYLKGQDKYICKYCGTMVFRNDKVKFKHRLKEEMIRKRKENGTNND